MDQIIDHDKGFYSPYLEPRHTQANNHTSEEKRLSYAEFRSPYATASCFRAEADACDHAFLRRFEALPPSFVSWVSAAAGLVASLSVSCSTTRPESS